MMLTPNFADTEFDRASSGGRYPDEWRSSKLPDLARIAQAVRDIAGVPGVVNSAWRSLAHNARVGGSDTSQHPDGDAADVGFWLISPRTLAARIIAAKRAGKLPPFGQIIVYNDTGHVHLSRATMGSRNGELRYSYTAGGKRFYPLLDAVTVNKVALVSDAQARGGLCLGIITAGFLFYLTRTRASHR